jgi:hypothetical protein
MAQQARRYLHIEMPVVVALIASKQFASQQIATASDFQS